MDRRKPTEKIYVEPQAEIIKYNTFYDVLTSSTQIEDPNEGWTKGYY